MDTRETNLPEGSQERKDLPIASGVLDYFPAAIAYVAKISKAGNDKHNPGEPLHWARGKSTDHADCIIRHFMDRGGFDKDGLRHSGMMVWRALALLQEELEREEGAPLPRGAWLPPGLIEVEPQPTLAWNEGWVCPNCGSTVIYETYDQDKVEDLIAEGSGPVCNTLSCGIGNRMFRAGR